MSKNITALLLDYISEHKLTDKKALPAIKQLLKDFKCESEELNDALQTLESQGIIKQKENQWIVSHHTVIDEHDGFSFVNYAKERKQKLKSLVLEKTLRTPIFDDDNPALTGIESKAHKSLKLDANEPFIAIARVRFLDNIPKIIHRVYLDPKRFVPDFLDVHDFANESLIHIYQNSGYKLTSINTRLRARHAYLHDKIDFLKNLPREYEDFSHKYSGAILYTEQELFAENKATGKNIILEFLHAAYVDMAYDILDHPVK